MKSQGQGTGTKVNEEWDLKKQNYVGIDVSARTFTVIIDHDGNRGEAFDEVEGHRLLATSAG